MLSFYENFQNKNNNNNGTFMHLSKPIELCNNKKVNFNINYEFIVMY